VPGPAQYDAAVSSIRVGHRNKPLPAPPTSLKFLAPGTDAVAVATAAAADAMERARAVADGETAMKRTRTVGQKNQKKRQKKSKKKVRARPSSAMEAAAEEAATKTTFGVSGRGDASHWNWVKSGSRPSKVLGKVARKRRHKLRKDAADHPETANATTSRFGGVLEPSLDALAKTLPKRKFRKPRKDPSVFLRPPVDVDNYVASHTHLGMTYAGSFGDLRARGATSRQGTFASGSRADRAERVPRADMSFPAPNHYGDVNPTFGSARADSMRMAKWVEHVKMLPGGSRKIDRAVAMLAELPTGCSMVSQRKRYGSVPKSKQTKKKEAAVAAKTGTELVRRSKKKKTTKKKKKNRTKNTSGIITPGEGFSHDDNNTDENVSSLENHLCQVNTDAIASKAEMALLRARLRSAGFVSGGKGDNGDQKGKAQAKHKKTRKKRTTPHKALNKAERLRERRQRSASPSFGNAGLGGTRERFPMPAGTFYPGPGHYGDFDSFKAAPTRPMTAASVLSAMAHVQRETIALERGRGDGDMTTNTKKKRARSASASGLFSASGPHVTQNFSTFGASERGNLLDYQRRYGIGVGGQASPGPAHYGIPQRSDRCFGGRIRSANRVLQQQEESQRKVLLVEGDTGKDIRRGIALLRERAQSASRFKSTPATAAASSPVRSVSAHLKKIVPLASPFRLKRMHRPSSAPLSPGKRAVSHLSHTAPPSMLHYGGGGSGTRGSGVRGGSGVRKANRSRVTIQEDGGGGGGGGGKNSPSHHGGRRPASASGGISSPSHPTRRRPRPASSKPRASPEKKAPADTAYEDEYLVEEDSDWEEDGEDEDDFEGIEADATAQAVEKDEGEAIPKKRRTSKRELLANVKELAKRALALSSATRATVDKLSSE
jgi:hypothetical protein